MSLTEAEEGFEVVFFVEDVGGDAKEGQEDEDETHLSALGAGLFDRDCSAL